MIKEEELCRFAENLTRKIINALPNLWKFILPKGKVFTDIEHQNSFKV
ncbi:hypothetical protein [Algoriphagus chordae]|nr:hypothetical protein [Algoriphagus chordae]